LHAVNAAVEEAVRANGMTATGSVLREEACTYWAGRQCGGKPGDRRAGVVWHTQGSGKSFSGLFFAARVFGIRRYRTRRWWCWPAATISTTSFSASLNPARCQAKWFIICSTGTPMRRRVTKDLYF
jgi:hypothetical protein